MDRTSFPNSKQQDKSFYSGSNVKSAPSVQLQSTMPDDDCSYINSLIEDICQGDGELITYKKMIEKKFPSDSDFYSNCQSFIDEVKNSVKLKKFTSTCVKNLEFLGEEVHLLPETIRRIVAFHQNRWNEEEQNRLKSKEAERQRIEEEERARREAEERQQREAKERFDSTNRNYIIGISLTGLISLICIAFNGWSIFFSFFFALGMSVLLGLWGSFIKKNSTPLKKHIEGILIAIAIAFIILFFIVFVNSHPWGWSLFTILLAIAYGVVASQIYEEA